MQPDILHFPQPQPAPPTEPPPPPSPQLPLPTVFVAPVWTYRHVERPLAEVATIVTELEALGAQGWELAGITDDGRTAHFFLKRLVR